MPHYAILCLKLYLYLLRNLRAVFVCEVAAAVIFFVLCCPCNNSSCLLRVILCVQHVSVPLQQACWSSCILSFPIFLHHILDNTYLLFVVLGLFLFCFLNFFFFLIFMVWFFLFCSCTRYTNIFLAFLDELRLLGLLCFTLCGRHIFCISLVG